MKNLNPQKNDQFDQIIVSRLLADDFAQPQVKDFDFYKERAVSQIQTAIHSIYKSNNQYEFTIAIAQANAFIDSALNLEIIDLAEKAKWLDDVAKAMRVQRIGEYP
ncbi:hypothetical protein HYG93_07505 [Acinetobacter sp. SwsAc6]|uniref:hypothetical protein n=1 Tax=Acinetobacter sp. SwsAc6 TaxID=2749439 RepID=UPI0015BBD399|nr:hypothetical protein [Acinetobacter sp. SwsAc6]NWK74135.1 hypothetical protein [Acinetobacter sp. SwsAc6]